MNNESLITKFYEAFKAADAAAMTACYHKDILFKDPAFGELKGEQACNMWKMLLKRSSGALKIDFGNIRSLDNKVYADWTARYPFRQTGRMIFNRIHAEFEFRDGLIIRHIDKFNIWKWAGMALGLKGYLLGWTGIMKKGIRKQTAELLRNFKA